MVGGEWQRKRSERLADQTGPREVRGAQCKCLDSERARARPCRAFCFTLYLVGSEKPLKSFKGVEGSWAGLHCEILPALTVGEAGSGGGSSCHSRCQLDS